MTWIKLDDKAPRHPKIGGLSDRAFRWWVRGLCYASEFLTDGLLPFIFTRDVPQKTINELTTARLWTLGEQGYHIHNYVEHQSVKADVERERERSRERMAEWRMKRKRYGVTGAQLVTGGDGEVRSTENREQRTDTENRVQTPTVSYARPLVGSALDFDKTHGKHVTGFCGFVCLPAFLFDGWVTRVLASGLSEDAARAQVLAFATAVKARWTGSGQVPGGDELAFWRAEWSNAHPAPSVSKQAPARSSTAAYRAALAAKGQVPS